MTRVVFRVDRGEIVAVLPDVPANPGNVMCYAHVGQHAEGSIAWYRARTKPASREAYAPLLQELEGIYGPVQVLARRPR